MKILVIENEEPVRAGILELLAAEDFDAIGAENGRVGVQLAQDYLPDLILCDVMMPELDGYSVLDVLQQDSATATIPFIFLTAKATQFDRRQGMEQGADDYLTKPFTPEELLAAIATRLKKQQAVAKQSQQKLDNLRNTIALTLPHELLTPLNTMLCSSEILISEAHSLERQVILEMAEMLHAAAERLHRLIQNFLLYAKLEIAARDPERIKGLQHSRTPYPQSVIRNVATHQAKQFGREADLKLKLQQVTVQISETNLAKLVEELADNAFKYSHAGTPVRITSLSHNRRFTLEITDQGRGMTASQIAELGAYMQFERRLYEQQGSGLGLIIAKRLAELHGGEFLIKSVPDQGTTVRVTLPT